MRLYLIRHGQTDWNKVRRLQGRVDIPLNEFGIQLAKETAEGLADVPFNRCFSSPLKRAATTAKVILDGRDVPITYDPRIIEMAFGEIEGGCCSEEGWNVPESFRLFFTDPAKYQAPEGGEDFYDMRRRLSGFLDWLFAAEEYQQDTILITTHGAALAGMINYIKKEPISRYWGKGVHMNCGVTLVEVTGGTPEIIFEDKVYYKDTSQAW